MSPVNRKQVVVHKSLADADDNGYMPGSEAERLAAVWELTCDVWSFFGKENAERRLQRHVAVLTRPEG
jgi:hypothetical protein